MSTPSRRRRRIRIAVVLAALAAGALTAIPGASHHGTADLAPPYSPVAQSA